METEPEEKTSQQGMTLLYATRASVGSFFAQQKAAEDLGKSSCGNSLPVRLVCRALIIHNHLVFLQVQDLDVIQARDLGHHLSNLHIPASSQAVQGSELMRSGTAAESALLLGGDLLITVWHVSLAKP